MPLLLRLKSVPFVLILFIVLLFTQINFAQDQDVATISVKEKSVKVKQGEQVSVDLLITVNSGWHMNSNKPNDEFLIPSVITAKSNTFKLVEIKYQKQKK